MEKKGKKVTPKALDVKQEKDIAGGYYYDKGYATGLRHEVLDDATGEVVGRYSSKKEALRMAEEKGQSKSKLDWDTITELRRMKTR